MCGVCGQWNLDGAPVDPVLLADMRDAMAHRGPDGAGCVMFATDGSERTVFEHPDHVSGRYDLGMASRRLSIIDLSTGDQPMSNGDGSLWIVFNGEIYNFQELRRELKKHGHNFRTSSDTEVILHAYEEYGEDCPNHLNGIFGFAIWDVRRKSLFLARDHFGVKPLYYTLVRNRFYFGSELKTILRDPAVHRELDLNALNLCLTFRYTPAPQTLFRGVSKLPPGSSLTVTRQGLRSARYWTQQNTIDEKPAEAEWVERLRSVEEEAVVRQMVSDVPIGISLSSGVDSTAMLALMSRHSSGPVKAFTVGFAGREDVAEIGPAREQAKRFGAEFHEYTITAGDYTHFMERYLWHLEEPIGNESAAAYYFVAEMAHRQGVKVLLNGQGADEAFAGYPRYLQAAYGNFLRWGAFPPIPWLMTRVLGARAMGERYRRFLYTIDATSEEDHFLRVYSILDAEARRELLRPEILEQLDPELPVRCVYDQLLRAPRGTALERMTYVDARTSLPEDLLLCEDKMAMAASVEARVPFLDLEVMKVAEQIPGRFKLKGLRDKYIHRKAATEWVGEKVTSRPQIGFDDALGLWLRSEFGDHMRDLVGSSGSFTSTYFNRDYVLRLMKEHSDRRRNHQLVLFLLLSIESWHEVFFKNTRIGGD